jgi:Ca2+:H+ antiporter
VAGICYRPEFKYTDTIAQTMSSLMIVATSSLILPAAFESALPHDSSTEVEVLSLSRGAAIVLLTIYFLYLVFQFLTHSHLFIPDEETAPRISTLTSILAIIAITVSIAFCSDYLIGSIDKVVESSGISKTFIGLILFPIFGNAGICVLSFSHA